MSESEAYYYVYMHVNKTNNKKYIGITKTSLSKRWGKDGHQYLNNKQPAFAQAIMKYGWDNFEHIILFENLTQEEACEKEIELISKFQTTNSDYGYNIQLGGQLGNTDVIFTDEHKQKLSIAHKGKKLSDEHKKKISENCKGHKPAIHTAEFIQRQRERNTGKVMSDESKKKISQSLTGVKRSVETLKKRKEHNPLLVSVFCPELNMTFACIADAAMYSGAHRSNIQQCLRGERHTAGKHPKTQEKLHWKKVEK